VKRAGNLTPKLLSSENIMEAIREVNRTHRRGRHRKPNRCVAWVERTLPERVEELRAILRDGFTPAPARRRTIYDVSSRKTREIYEPRLWPDQYVHHALIRVISPLILRGMDAWVCGSVPGRGAHYGAKGIRRWMRSDVKGTKYCLTMDIHHFYQSLSPRVVMYRMRQLIKDRRVLALIRETLHDGVPIGAYCSQWYANAVLEPLDRFIRSQPGAAHYVRYMDNFTIFGPNKKQLRKLMAAVDGWLRRCGMQLNRSRQVFPVKSRLPDAMGYRYGRGCVLPRKKNALAFKRACRRCLKRLRSGLPPTLRQAQSLLSRRGYLLHCNARRLIHAWFDPVGERLLKDVIRKNALPLRAA